MKFSAPILPNFHNFGLYYIVQDAIIKYNMHNIALIQICDIKGGFLCYSNYMEVVLQCT